MSYFLWTDDVVTGNHVIDAEHRKLTMLVDTLISSCESGATAETVALQIGIIVLFSIKLYEREDLAMQRACYQAKDAHIADHLKRLEDLSSLAMQIESKLQYCAQDVYSYFRAWLSDHIFNYDIPMVQAFHLVDGTVE